MGGSTQEPNFTGMGMAEQKKKCEHDVSPGEKHCKKCKVRIYL